MGNVHGWVMSPGGSCPWVGNVAWVGNVPGGKCPGVKCRAVGTICSTYLQNSNIYPTVGEIELKILPSKKAFRHVKIMKVCAKQNENLKHFSNAKNMPILSCKWTFWGLLGQCVL